MFDLVKKYVLLLLLCFVEQNTFAQNLVPNPSFENFTSCPTAAAFYKVAPWCGLSGGEDAYNACFNTTFFPGPGGLGVPYNFFGFQYPRTGDGIGTVMIQSIGMGVQDHREYLHVPLINTLRAGKTYCATMYVNLYNQSKFTTDQVGMYFSSAPFACNQAMPLPQWISPLNVIPQVTNTPGLMITDTLNWMEVSGAFTAVGNEKYLTIGNFTTDAMTNTMVTNPSSGYTVTYFLIEDVSLEEIQPATLSKDSVYICSGESIVLKETDSVNAAQYSWLPTSGLSCINCRTPIASPTVSTTYTFTKTQCKAVTQDVVYVEVKTNCDPSNMPQLEIPNVFTPNGDGKNDTFYVDLDPEFSNISFMVYNRWGLIVKQLSEPTYNQINWDGRTTSGEPCNAGVYFYVLQYKNAKGDLQKKNGYITLIK